MKYIRNRGSLGLLPQLPVTGALSSFGVRTGRDRAVLGNLNQAERKDWLSGYSYRKSFTYSRPSGAVSDYQVKILVGESASPQLFDCEATTGWTDNCTLTTDTGYEGTNCLKMDGWDTPHWAYKAPPVTDMRGWESISLWHKATGSPSCRLVVYFINFAYNYAYWNFSPGADWSQSTFDLSSPDFTNGTQDWSNIYCIALQNLTGFTFLYFDDIRLIPQTNCNAHCLSTFADLRFTKSDGTTELDYWIESVTGSTPNCLATVWVELDSVGTDATTFYMYYGKADATTTSNGANTFIFFEPFDGDAINEDVWTLGTGTVSVGSGVAVFAATSGNTQSQITSKTNWSIYEETAIRSRIKFSLVNSGVGEGDFGGYGSSQEYILADVNHRSSINRYKLMNHTGIPTSVGVNLSGISADTYHVLDLSRPGKSSLTVDGGSAIENASQVTEDSLPIFIRCNYYNGDSTVTVDWVLVRKCYTTEPALGSWGSEEAA